MKLIQTYNQIVIEQEQPSQNEWQAKKAEAIYYIDLFNNAEEIDFDEIDLDNDSAVFSFWSMSDDQVPELHDITFTFTFYYDAQKNYGEYYINIDPAYLVIRNEEKTIYYGTDFSGILLQNEKIKDMLLKRLEEYYIENDEDNT